ncbi:DUF1254 domain-containing protein [Aquabacter sp. L1I39]|uniref:DUF1254 domain-containing protein n=1 Tax=Aquabacter sp. L1I39 TaxID=2820278 RepID=UPI001ADA5C78|nr:DUF1254 domain-containing protein [Aquabacter sp. L1I39]QTL04531.1 DUF1254 domain-containing protein [Aquabacter sp. L1I39]
MSVLPTSRLSRFAFWRRPPEPEPYLEFHTPRRTRGAALWEWLAKASGQLALGLAFILVLAGIVHLASVLAMPLLATNNAFARLTRIAPMNGMTLLPDPSPSGMTLPLSDPAFVSAVCLYDLADHPLKVRVPATSDYTSVSFYTARGVPFYALNDQAAGRVIELDLLSPMQRAALPEDEEITAADRLIVESPSLKGVVLIRAFARYPDTRDAIRRQLEAATCMPST